MNESTVYFTRREEDIPAALRLAGVDRFSGAAVPVKLHMGEPGNPYALQPALARTVVGAIIDAGGRPFLFDTTVAYPGERSRRDGYERVARRHGFTLENVGCSTVIGDRGVRTVESGVAVEVATALHDASCMLVLSHVKGHIQAGVGGAIKNLGMGGVTKASKRLIHHMARPVHNRALCTLCGRCGAACPSAALSVDTEWHFDGAACEGCGKCALACDTGALQFEVMSLARALAISALACVRGKDVLYVSSLHNMAANCDCDPNPGGIICPDVGYLIGSDAAAVDAAALDLIDRVKPDVFKRCTGVDPRDQVREAASLGMNDRYVLREL